MEGNRPGSFGLPPEVKKQIEAAQNKRDNPLPPPKAAQEAPPVADEKTTEEKSQEEKEREEFVKIKETHEKRLGIKITEEIVSDYLFRGRMTITDVTIVPGKMTGTFRTLLTEDHDSISDHVAAFKKKYLEEKGIQPDASAISNEQGKWILAYAWISAEDKERKKGGAFAKDPVERYAGLKAKSTHLMEKATETWNNLEWLIRLSLEEDRFTKKS